MSDRVLSIEDLKVVFVDKDGVNTAVKGATMHVDAGEVLGIVGESGSGKTVTCASAMGLLSGNPGIVGGRILFDPGDGKGPRNLLDGMDKTISFAEGRVPIKDQRAWRFFIKRQFVPWWGRGMTMIFQNPQRALNPFWKVSRLVGEAVRQREKDLDKAKVRQRGIAWLERVRLNNPERVWNSHPHELSGGMAQRVMVAASLARGARLLFADEPTTGLDTTVKARIVELFSELRRTEKLALVVISHDLGVVSSLANRIVVMKRGDIIETRRVEEITGRSHELHEYTRQLLSAVDVWSTKDSDKASGEAGGGDQPTATTEDPAAAADVPTAEVPAAEAVATTEAGDPKAESAAEPPSANPGDESAEEPAATADEEAVPAASQESEAAPAETKAEAPPSSPEAEAVKAPEGTAQGETSDEASPKETSDGAS